MRLVLPALAVTLFGACTLTPLRTPPDLGGGERPAACDDPTTWYYDDDEDGFGRDSRSEISCVDLGAGWSRKAGDCDDSDPGTWPGAIEACDGIDRDCDGIVDGDPVDGVQARQDRDGDGFGDMHAPTVLTCPDVPGFVPPVPPFDCDDTDTDIHPGADDPLCDGIDQGCTGTADEVARLDGDSFVTLDAALSSASSGVLRICPGEYTLPGGTYSVDHLYIESATRQAPEVVLTSEHGRILDLRASDVTLQYLTFRGGRAAGDGGGLRVQATALALRHLNFEDNRAAGDGGAIAAWAERELHLDDVRIHDAHAAGSGGGLSLILGDLPDRPSSNVFVVEDLAIENTTAGLDGGAVRLGQQGEAWWTRWTGLYTRGTRAARDGGSVALVDLEAWFLCRECTLSDGQAGGSGGLIAARSAGSSAVNLYGTRLEQGRADAAGGLVGIEATGSVELAFHQGTATNGHARSGGLVAVQGSTVSAWLQTSSLDSGQADTGSAVWIRADDRIDGFNVNGSSVSRSRGDAAIVVDAPELLSETSIGFRGRRSYATRLRNNEQAAIRLSESLSATFDEVDFGRGSTANGGPDLIIGSTEHTVSSDSVLCDVDACTAWP